MQRGTLELPLHNLSSREQDTQRLFNLKSLGLSQWEGIQPSEPWLDGAALRKIIIRKPPLSVAKESSRIGL